MDVAGCAAGTAVPKPAANPGLVQDCETLLVVQAQLAGVGRLGWTTDRPLKEWEGVLLGDPQLEVYRTPLRVRRLRLYGGGLRAEIPPALGALTELEILSLSWNKLSGAIPPELGALTKLKHLNLVENNVSGAIPPELGQLANLEGLFLSGNRLSGCIPPALHRVSDNDLAKLGLPDCELG